MNEDRRKLIAELDDLANRLECDADNLEQDISSGEANEPAYRLSVAMRRADAKVVRSALSHLREGSGTGGGETRAAIAIAEAEHAHWLKEAAKHARPSGRNSDCATRDLDRAKVAQRIVDKLKAGLPVSPSPDKVEEVARKILEHVSGRDPDELIHHPAAKSWEPPTEPRWTQFKELATAILGLLPSGGGGGS